AVLFALPAMSLAGIPPFSGFLAKVALLVSAPGQGLAALAGAAVLIVASLLTVRVMAGIWTRAFWGEPVPPQPDRDPRDGVRVGVRVPPVMQAASGVLAAAGMAIVVAAGPVQALTERAATDLLERTPYVEAVLGDG
ncbi:MAG TPA: Na+/H+ antiporter subunit D, partial [Pseudonocardia sp.]|nr:Na+/H+ antiporter subunit D [Pseudonocardia sp.]